MGKNYSKQPLSQDELYSIYNNYNITSNAKIAKSQHFLPLDLTTDNDNPFNCFICMPTKNRQKKWRKFLKNSCHSLKNRYQWAKLLLREIKKFPSRTDKKYLIDLTWLKLSLFDDNHIEKSLKLVAPEYQKRASLKHQEKNLTFVNPSLCINGGGSKNSMNILAGIPKAELPYTFEIDFCRPQNQNNENNSKDIRKSDNNIMKNDIMMRNLNDVQAQSDLIKENREELEKKVTEKFKSVSDILEDRGYIKEYNEDNEKKIKSIDFERKKDFFHEFLKESLILEEKDYLTKPEKDLSRLSFFFENNELNKQNEEISELQFYRHNTFINSIKTLETSNYESIYEDDEKKLNELIRAITHYKVLTEEIEKHLKDDKMVLCNLKDRYVDYYINKYDGVIRQKEQFLGGEGEFMKVIDEAFEDLKQFIEIFHQVIYYFYKIQYLDQRILIQKSFFKPENIHNFLTSLLMDKQIYSILYLSLIQIQEKKEDSLRLALKFCHNLEPEDFEVSVKYCLNQSTLNFYKCSSEFSLLNKGISQECLKHQNKNLNHNHNLEDLYKNSNKPQNQEENKNQPQNLQNFEKINKIRNKMPYESAIKCLQEIEFLRSPLHKLKALVKTGDEILQSIEEFHSEYNIKYSKDSLNADDLLPIFTYVVAKSQVKCFYSQIKIIDELASRNLKNTLSGYYFVTLQIALNLIERAFQENLEKEKEAEIERIIGKPEKMSLRSSFSEKISFQLNEIKECAGIKKSFFSRYKDF